MSQRTRARVSRGTGAREEPAAAASSGKKVTLKDVAAEAGVSLGMASRVQEEMQKAQADLDRNVVEGASGGGLVEVRASA